MKKDIRTAFSTRQYMLSEDFEIYYYSDRHMKNVSAHSHDYYEFYFFLDGDVRLEIDDQSCMLRPCDMVVIPPQHRHRMYILNPELPYSRFVFWVSCDYLHQLTSQSESYGYLAQLAKSTKNYLYHFDTLAFNAIQSKIFRLIEELHQDNFGKDAKIPLCVSDLILSLCREVFKMNHPAVPAEQRSLYQNLLSYIESHPDEPLLLDQLAARFYVSKYHISHLFKEYFGISMHQYILKKRLQLSREAILTHASIGEAIQTCGFKDYSSFYRAFKKEYGISPQEYKRRFTSDL